MVAITIDLDERATAAIDHLVREGHFASPADVITAGIRFVDDDVKANGWTPTAADIAAIEEGLADVAAGRTYPADEVFAELRARYAAWPR